MCRPDLKKFVFEPIFKQILGYVQGQAASVSALGPNSHIKVSLVIPFPLKRSLSSSLVDWEIISTLEIT
jgi:hypothetical protein